MGVTDHFKYRYCQRVLGIQYWREIKRYVAVNDNKITNHCLKLFEYSKFIGKKNVSGNILRKFYQKGNYLLVVDTSETNLITILKINKKDIHKFMEDEHVN